MGSGKKKLATRAGMHEQTLTGKRRQAQRGRGNLFKVMQKRKRIGACLASPCVQGEAGQATRHAARPTIKRDAAMALSDSGDLAHLAKHVRKYM